MPSSPIFYFVALLRTDVSEERIVSVIRLEVIIKLRTTVLRFVLQLLVTANVFPSSLTLVTLMMEAIRSPEAPILTGAPWRHIPEDSVLLIYV
jgi:hypothetical protein